MGFYLIFWALLTQAQSLPYRLSDARIFSNLERLEIAEGGFPYEVNVPFWSDGAEKSRWILLPAGKRIQFHSTETWELPVGTKLVKHIDLAGPKGRIRVETRILVHEDGGWRGYSYQWNKTETDAERVDDGAEQRYPVAGGGTQLWRFPSRFECLTCHQPNAGSALGIRSAQLNRTVRETNQILLWSKRGVFNEPVENSATLPSLPSPWDEQIPIASRARAYLDANCGYCHRPGGPGPMDLRFETPIEKTQTVREPVTGVDPEDPHGLRLVPGDPEHSAIWRRASATSQIVMPPLGKSIVDSRGSQLLRDWILSLKP